MRGRVGVGLRPGDSGIKQDLYHGIERIDQVLRNGHALKQSAKSLFYEVFLVEDEEQLIKWQEAGGKAKYPNKEDHVQCYIPPPDILLPRFDNLVARCVYPVM